MAGDAHGGRARMYDFAKSTGEPTSSSITYLAKISCKTQTLHKASCSNNCNELLGAFST